MPLNEYKHVFGVQDSDVSVVVWNDGSFGLWYADRSGLVTRVDDFRSAHIDVRFKVLGTHRPGTNDSERTYFTESGKYRLIVHVDGSTTLEIGGDSHEVLDAYLKVVDDSHADEPAPAECCASECACAPEPPREHELRVKIVPDTTEAVDYIEALAAAYRELAESIGFVNDEVEKALELRREAADLAGDAADGFSEDELVGDDREGEIAANVLYAFRAGSVRFDREEAGDVGHAKAITFTAPRTLRLRFADVMNHPIALDPMNHPNVVVVGNVAGVELS